MQSSIFGDLAIVVGIILAAAALFIAMVGFGFYLGRKTIIRTSEKRRCSTQANRDCSSTIPTRWP
jgi:hypothetical protein